MRRANHLDRNPKPPTGGARRPLAGLLLALAAVAAAAQSPPASDQHAITLAEALREIEAHSSAAVTASLDVNTAREATKRAEASFKPSVALSGGYQLRDHKIIGSLAGLEVPESESSFFTGELDATQLLWDGGRRSSVLSGSRSVEQATTLRGQADVRAVQLQGLTAYMGVLAIKAQRRVVAQRLTSLEDHLREVHDLFDHGVVARNDLLETEVRLRLVQDQVGRLDNGEAVALQTLNRQMGRRPEESLAVLDRLPSPPPLPGDGQDLKKRAAGANPQLLALRARLKSQEDAVAVARDESAPTVFAQASHTYQQNRYLLYPNANLLFLGVSWQAYDGGARLAGVRQAEFAAQRTRQEIADLQRALDIQVEQAYREYGQALKEAATAEVNVKAAEENLRIEEDQYKAGLARTTDVLDAESVLADSRFSLVNQHYRAYLSQGTLLAVAGEDLAAFFATVGGGGQER